MQRPIFQNLENDINVLIDSASESFIYSREELQELILSLLNETYNALNRLNEARFKNDLPKIEHDRQSSIKLYISHYKILHDKSLENEDPDLAWRYGYMRGLYEAFQKDPAKTLGLLKVSVVNAKFNEVNPDFAHYFLNFIRKNDPKHYDARRRYIEHFDIYLELFKQLEGYQVTHALIVKSSALRLFHFFNVVTKVQKKALANNIEFLFATLGETISLDTRRAWSIKQIGEFNQFPIYDYLGNKKTLLHDFGLDEVFDQILLATIKQLQQMGKVKEANRLIAGRAAFEMSLSFDLLLP